MMKVMNNDLIYHIPIKNGVSLISGNQINNLINLFNKYFLKGKKSDCIILDDEDEIIGVNEVSFIHISRNEDLSQIFDFKSKTILNNEISEFIEKNQEMFISIEKIREGLYDLLTDKGMFKIKKILQTNTNLNLEYKISDFDISRILQSISIDYDKLSDQLKFIVLYNLLIYINRDKYCIVYIDFDIDDITLEWINKYKCNNILFLLNNEFLITTNTNLIDYLLILSKYDFVNFIESDRYSINDISYCLHPHTLRNIYQQNEKNKNIINKFIDDKATFLVKFTDLNDVKSL